MDDIDVEDSMAVVVSNHHLPRVTQSEEEG